MGGCKVPLVPRQSKRFKGKITYMLIFSVLGDRFRGGGGGGGGGGFKIVELILKTLL